MTALTANQREAVRLFGVYTAGRFDPYMLAGRAKASTRSHVMEALRGVKLPQSQCGVTILREQFIAMAGIEPNAMTLAAQDTKLAEFCKEVQ